MPGARKEPLINLEVPSRLPRIQLFGKSRKKLNQLQAPCSVSSPDQQPFIAIYSPPPPISKSHTNSIGSKLATATFGHSRLLKPSQPEPARPSTFTSTASTSISQPSSYESGSSTTGTWPRSTAPRPSQPLIKLRVSSSDNLSEHKNLFTRPPPQNSNVTPSVTPPPSPTSWPASFESGSSSGSWAYSATPRPSQPLIKISLNPYDLSEYKDLFTRPLSQDFDVTINPTPRSPPSDKGYEKTPRPSGAQESVTAVGEKRLPLCLRRHPSPVTRSVQSTRAPSLTPLPQTPSSPPLEVLLSPLRQTSNTELEATVTQKPIAHSRAHRMELVSNSPLPADQFTPSNTTRTLSPPSMDILEANFDIDTAPAVQLRKALRTRNQELITYRLKLTNLEKKHLALEKEVVRKDAELQDLRWIINNGDLRESQLLSTPVLNPSQNRVGAEREETRWEDWRA